MAGGVCGRRDGHYSGWYASYWNAFLLSQFFGQHVGMFHHVKYLILNHVHGDKFTIVLGHLNNA